MTRKGRSAPSALWRPPFPPDQRCARCDHEAIYHVFGACDYARGGEGVDDCPEFARASTRPDGIPTRADQRYWSKPERAIAEAIRVVESAGASVALTDAVVLLGQARDRVADHAEGKP